MIDQKLIDMLRCPASGQKLRMAETSTIEQINEQIARGELRDRMDQRVEGTIDGGLINPEGTLVYPIRGGIPSLVEDAAIVIQPAG